MSRHTMHREGQGASKKPRVGKIASRWVALGAAVGVAVGATLTLTAVLGGPSEQAQALGRPVSTRLAAGNSYWHWDWHGDWQGRRHSRRPANPVVGTGVPVPPISASPISASPTASVHEPVPPTSESPTTTPVSPTTSRTVAPTTSAPAPTTSKALPTTSAPSGGTGAESALEQQVVTLVNQQRASNGCKALAVNATLVTVARAHSQDMAVNNYFTHNSQDGTTPFERMTAAGYSYSTAAENIAAGYSTAELVMNTWMNSPGHRANILNCSLTEIGVGYYQLSPSTYGTYWTQDFGTPR
jgi:uncharacterized protein YkwD